MQRTDTECRVVTQRGVVTELDEPVAHIQIVQRSACASCAVKAICAPSESRPRRVTVPATADLTVGMSVDVTMRESLGWLGVVVAFVIPLFIVVGALFGLRGVWGSDEIAVGIGLAALVPYFYAIWLLRFHFERIVNFEATPASPTLLVYGGTQ